MEISRRNMQYMLLKDVNRQTYKWKVLVRLARIWEFRDQQTGTILYEVDFVAVDQQGGTTEGYIPNNRVDQFKDKLKEGSVYSIEQFVLSDAKKAYRSVEHPYRIRFTQRTRMTEMLAVPENFPLYAYNAKPWDILATRMNDNTILSDVVGLITAVTDISTAPSTQQPKRQVFITNGSDRAIVTLWGDHAETFEAEDIRIQSQQQPMVVLFVGMTVSQFSGLLAFKSTSVTKWYLNIPIKEMVAIREATRDQSYQVDEQGSSRPKGEPTENTLTVLTSSSPYDHIGDRFKLNVQLTDLLTKDNWWYLSCKSCWKKMQPDGADHKCPRCSSFKAEPRYKITYAGIDSTDEQGNGAIISHFTFLGQAGVALTKTDEVLLVPDTRNPPAIVPRCLLEPIGKEYVLTAELTDNSLDSDYLCFQVNAVDEVVITGPPATNIGDNIIQTPPEDTIANIASKAKGNVQNRKREISPSTRPGGKKGKGGKTSTMKQLSFADDKTSAEATSTKDIEDV